MLLAARVSRTFRHLPALAISPLLGALAAGILSACR
jgi:hypothetical protein